jgi:hypothetical protein
LKALGNFLRSNLFQKIIALFSECRPNCADFRLDLKKISESILCFLLLLSLLACDELPCVEQKTPAIGLAFFRDSSGVFLPHKTRFQFIKLYTEGRQFNSSADSLLKIQTSPALKFSIPISVRADSAILVIQDSLSVDSIFLAWERGTQFVSESCGYLPAGEDLKAKILKSKRFDKIKVINPWIDSSRKTHVQVYF